MTGSSLEEGSIRAASSPEGPILSKGFLWMALASVSFAFMKIFARLAQPHVPWAEVAAARSLMGVVVSFGIARMRGASLGVTDQRRAWGRSLAGTVSVVMTFYVLGAPEIHVGDVATLGATSPIFIALFAPHLLGEKGGSRLWIAALVAFTGVLVLVRPRLDIAGHLAGLTLAGSLFSAFAMIQLRRLGPKESPEAVVCHFSVVSCAALLLLSIPGWVTPGGRGLALMFATGVAGGFAQLAMTRAYALDHAARVGIFGYVGVVVTQLLGVLMLNEDLGEHQVLGSTLVMVAGVILAGQSRPARSQS